jgi:hypothetical protein
MEVTLRERLTNLRYKLAERFTDLFFTSPIGTEKRELRISRLKWVAVSGIVLFVVIVLFMPEESDLQFAHKSSAQASNQEEASSSKNSGAAGSESSKSTASSLWGSPKNGYAGGSGSLVNQNTSMIVGPKGGNAKTQLRAGVRLPIRIIDKFVVSQDAVPVLAELILDSVTDSGLRLPAGTRLYGEASFQKGSERASIQFKQISLPSGQIRTLTGIAAGKDGQPGIQGHVFSDGMKNTAGQVLTTFVGGLAAGSMQTDIFGRSRGGIENGMLNAVSQTAQTRAQNYGEKLKTEREWIEVPSGQEADAILSESINLQEGGDTYEQR